ncbi:MAG: single-stranded DNA-binding protein [Oscillospiraceae bacterium]|nr:single-stranded DNA-binding protein [Oscillospiraceae bacterium]
MNKVILMGRLTRDPELRHTPSGSAVSSFGLAVDKYSKEGGRQADFFDIVCWERRAEFASKWLKKGTKIVLSGRLQQRKWKDKDGNDRVTVEVVAEELEFAESKSASESGGFGGSQPGAAPYAAQASGFAPTPAAMPLTEPSSFQDLQDDDGELPF